MTCDIVIFLVSEFYKMLLKFVHIGYPSFGCLANSHRQQSNSHFGEGHRPVYLCRLQTTAIGGESRGLGRKLLNGVQDAIKVWAKAPESDAHRPI